MPSARQFAHPVECGAHVGQPLLVVVGADAVLGDQDGHLVGDLPRSPDRGLQRLRIELVAHRQHRDAVLATDVAVGPDARAAVGLHADEVVAPAWREEDVLGEVRGSCRES